MAPVLAKPVANGGTKSWDITEEFTKAAAALEVGQLVKDDYFTLFESVAALEIMDPKMDSGVLQPGETLEHDYDLQKDLLPEEVIGIMDQLLCYEMVWHEGYPLSQNLFTSVHLDRLLWPEPRILEEARFDRGRPASPMAVMNQILRAYCLALIKCCDRVIQTVTSRDYYEEEDFSTHTYNRPLLTQIDETEIQQELSHCGEWLANELGTQHSMSTSLRRALESRLGFRQTLLSAMHQDANDPLNALDPLWRSTITFFSDIKSTHALGRPVPEAFSPKLQRRLASTVPPRPVVEYTFDEALQKMTLLCEHSLETIRAMDIGSSSTAGLLSFTWAFASHKPQPLAYPRALLASFIFGGPPEAFSSVLQRDMEKLVFTEDAVLDPLNWTIETSRSSLVPHDPRALMAKTIDDFLARTSQCYALREFDHLMADAEIFDNELRHLSKDTLLNPLMTWTYYHKLRQMEWVVQLGFEQEIYQPDELVGMYWWLSQIASSRYTVLEHILPFMRRRHTRFTKRKQVREASSVSRTVDYVDAMIREAKGTTLLAECLSTLYALLHYLKLLPVPERPFSAPALRYELRMKPFLLTVEPPTPPPFDEYRQRTHPLGDYDQPSSDELSKGLKAMSADADDAVKMAKAEFAALKKLGAKAARCEAVEDAWKKNIASMLSSCVAAGIATSAVKAACSERGGVSRPPPLKIEMPEAGKRYHDWWVVPKVVG
ncbi:N-alpha-acetyltransferase, non-catalitic subunit [Coniosporium apollinis]|uniref:N-alpha-acetyltransferase, non-catalitic subunit n=1 Tax=Coniosporium apollinis TaxID=61459 RepID=A0ABQ9NTI5_9PEZI|nr:N-alpha-acetyltransferase, non-catalitic subunit [Coniosporium apollinis]